MSPLPSPLDPSALSALAREVQARGLSPVAREIRVSRSSLAAVLGGYAREGTVALVALRLAERPEPVVLCSARGAR